MGQTITQQVDKWFRVRGLSLLLSGTPLGKRTTERATPALVGWFLLMLVVVVPLQTTISLLISVLLGVAVVVVTWLVANLARRRPLFSRVERIGWFESASFVLAPAVMIWFTIDPKYLAEHSAIEADILHVGFVVANAAVQLLVLLTVLALERLGLISLLAWLARTMMSSLSETGSALTTLLPVSLGLVFFFFLNPGVWGTIGALPVVAYLPVVGLLLALAITFLGAQRYLSLQVLTSFETSQDYRESLAETPLAAAPAPETPITCPLQPMQQFCIRQVAILSQLAVGLVIAAAVFVLFVLIGYLAVDPGTVIAWTRTEPVVLVKYAGLGHDYVLSVQHLKVAGFLATFAAFNYSLASATDARLRQSGNRTATQVIRQACAMRLALLAE